METGILSSFDLSTYPVFPDLTLLFVQVKLNFNGSTKDKATLKSFYPYITITECVSVGQSVIM